MTITFGRLVKSRVRRMVGLLAVASVAGAGLCGVASAAGLAAPVRVHRQVAPMVSPKAHRLVPQQGKAKGYSTGLLPRRSPKMVSEIVKDRTAMSSTWRDADGSMTIRRYLAPHFYQPSRSAGWVPIETTLTAVAGKPGWWRSGANSWHVSFGPAGAPGGTEQVSIAGANLLFAPEGGVKSGVAPSVSGSVATYHDVWPDTDMVEQVTTTGVAEDLVLTGPGAPSRFVFGLSGATARSARSGGLDLVAGGRQVGEVPPLTVQTSQPAKAKSGRPLSAALSRPLTAASGARLSAGGGQVIESVSPKWLASLPKSAFPVIIDPFYQVDTTQGASSLYTCVSGGKCTNDPAGTPAMFGAGSVVEANVPYPGPPTGGQQPWVPTEASLDVTAANPCSGTGTQCEMTNEFVFGEPTGPLSYSTVVNNSETGGQLVWQNTSGGIDGPGFTANIASWLSQSAHQSGSWFAMGGDGWTVSSTGARTAATLSIPASGISVHFVLYQEPPPPTVTSLPVAWPAGNVVATTEPTLTATRTDTDFCTTTDQLPSGNESCDQPSDVTYDFRVSTSPTWGSGQVVADSGWIQQPYKTGTDCAAGDPADTICLSTPSWTVPAGALTDGVTYYVTVQDSNSNQNFAQAALDGIPIVPAAVPLGPWKMTVKLRLGDGVPSPTDIVGAPPGQTSVPAQGAPSPGLSPASETVDMVTGNLALSVGTPSMSTLAGPAGVSLTYNSMQSATATGSYYGLNASYYPDSGNHQFPSSPAGSAVEPDIDLTNAPIPPVGGIPIGNAWLGRWTGTITLPAGTWKLGGLYDGGMQISLNGSSTPLYNDWTGTNSGAANPSFSSATVTGGAYQITVQNWQPAGDGLVQLWAEQITSPDLPQIVPSSWLSPGATGLPPGWSIGATTPAWNSATDMGTQVVLHSPTGGTETFTSNSNGTYTPQPGDTDSLTIVNHQMQVSSSDGYLYVFSTSGQLTSMTTIGDDRHPTALHYTYGPASTAAGSPVVLQSITDPVSGRSITLSYGTACGANGNNANLLCQITYFDQSSTIFGYNGSDQLDQVQSPSTSGTGAMQNITQLGYDSGGRLDDIRDAPAYNVLADAVPGYPTCTSDLSKTCALDTWISYDTSGRVTTVSQPVPAPSQPRPVREYAYYPSATTPGSGASTVTISGFNPAGTGCTQPAPGCSPADVADSYFYDSQGRINAETGPTGLTSYTVWDAQDRPIITDSSVGEQTSTVYDISSDATDTYGPAPVACFNSAIPAGVTAPGPVAGYLPPADPASLPGCGVAVPHTSNGYDQNIIGLADTFWANGQYAGAAALHSTGDGSSTSTSNPSDCSTPGSTPWGTDSSTDLCASWPSGTTPGGIGTDAAGQWSMQMTGTITVPVTGEYLWCVADTHNFTMSIDSDLALTNIEYQNASGGLDFDFQGKYLTTLSDSCDTFDVHAGVHTITISVVGSSSQITSYNVGYQPPDPDGGTDGPTVGVPLSWLDPAYGLKTSTTDPDGKTTTSSYSDPNDHIGPEYGLVTSTTQDPGGLNLTTATTYEDPTQGGYLRKTATTLPAGNQTTDTYYTGTGGPIASGATACLNGGTPDQGGQLEQLTGPAPSNGQPRVQQFVYDADGRQAGERIGSPGDIGNQPWQCTIYDAMSRMTQQTWPAANGAPARTVTHSYDVGGNPLTSSVSDASGTIMSTVDLLGRLVSYTDALGQTTTDSYNQAGQTTATDGPGGSLQYGFDPNSGQPTTTTTGTTLLATASYSAATSRMTGVTYGNGTKAAIGYDAYGNQDSLTYTNISTGNAITSDSITHTAVGRWATETASQGTGTLNITYGYDSAGRLTSADNTVGSTTTTNTYSYAASPSCSDILAGETTIAGENTNISSVATTTGGTTSTTSYCYNAADQLVSSTVNSGNISMAYAYNEHGDQTNDNGTTYSWDASDRVATVTTPGNQTVSSTYDALNRLIQSTQTVGSNDTTVRYCYAGYTDAPVAVLNTSGQVVQQIISLPGGVTDVSQSSGDTWDYTNLQGDTTATTKSSGTLTSGPVTYNPWGALNPGQTAPANATGPNTLGAYASGGKLTNTATGAILLGARTFNPTEARFLSVDPVFGGCANAYTYAFGDPLTGHDLTGQAMCGVPSSAHCKRAGNGFKCTIIISPKVAGEIAGYEGNLAIQLGFAATAGLVCALIAAAPEAAPGCSVVAWLLLSGSERDFNYAAQHNDYMIITIGSPMDPVFVEDRGHGGPGGTGTGWISISYVPDGPCVNVL